MAAIAKKAAAASAASKANGTDSMTNKNDAATSPSAVDSPAPDANASDDKDKDEVEEEEKQEKGQAGEAKAAMRSMTAYQQEIEREGVDAAKLEKAMALITEVNKNQKAEKAAKQQDVTKFTLAKEDVETLMAEMDMNKPAAEKHLKEHGGNLIKTLDALVNA
ncbi:hypothetical protein BGZ73_006461 [Actinomortierella ambigua]|nr:hypothetical protein BGZ73_006461 [Actinomortierella ambigua]